MRRPTLSEAREAIGITALLLSVLFALTTVAGFKLAGVRLIEFSPTLGLLSFALAQLTWSRLFRRTIPEGQTGFSLGAFVVWTMFALLHFSEDLGYWDK